MKHSLWLLPETPYRSYEEYLRENGPSAVTIGRRMTPERVVEEVERSGLRGRGGAGFPTGLKWRTIKDHSCPTHYVVCNAAEGEPGTFKDRYLLRRNPYACLEGLLIAAHAVHAKAVVVGIRASFALEVKTLRNAIKEMEAAGLFTDLPITVFEGPEEYLFGEEKGLLNTIEEGEPLPREAHYPPYERGLDATPFSPNPALVNNVETYAHIPGIIRCGAEAFRSIGTADTPGTLIFTISGGVKKPGVYELEAGISLRRLFYEVAGGPRNGEIKAAFSGSSSAVLVPENFHIRADFGSLTMAGSSLGAAGFIVLDGDDSVPRVAQAMARFLYVESCNQCTSCKGGLRTASTALDEMFDVAAATADDAARAIYGAQLAPQANRCYLPVQGALLIPSLVKGFRLEFDAQIDHPDRVSEAFTVPLITDFDEASRTFTYDSTFGLKNPDWTYSPPIRKAKVATPAKVAQGDVAIRIDLDVANVLLKMAEEQGIALDRLANRLLRDILNTKQ